MQKPLVNYAFIDGSNLTLSIREQGWNLDYSRFRVYLKEHYGVKKAYYFIGYLPIHNDIYNSLQTAGYNLIFKPTFTDRKGKTKGNCDAELVLQAMIDLANYQRAVIVSGDGDFYCLVNYLSKINKFDCVLVPNINKYSLLLRKSAGNKIAFISELQLKLAYKRKEPHEDGTS